MSRIISQCVYCGVGLTGGTLTIDHVIPTGRGGTNERHNKAPACADCNQEKGMLTAHEYLQVRGNRAELKAAKRQVSRKVEAAIIAGTLVPKADRAAAVARGKGCVAVDGYPCSCADCLRAAASARFFNELAEQHRRQQARQQERIDAAENERAQARADGRKAGT